MHEQDEDDRLFYHFRLTSVNSDLLSPNLSPLQPRAELWRVKLWLSSIHRHPNHLQLRKWFPVPPEAVRSDQGSSQRSSLSWSSGTTKKTVHANRPSRSSHRSESLMALTTRGKQRSHEWFQQGRIKPTELLLSCQLNEWVAGNSFFLFVFLSFGHFIFFSAGEFVVWILDLPVTYCDRFSGNP